MSFNYYRVHVIADGKVVVRTTASKQNTPEKVEAWAKKKFSRLPDLKGKDLRVEVKP